MNRLFGLGACAALVMGLSLACAPAGAEDEKDKPPSIKMIMTKAHKGGDSIRSKLLADLKSDEPDFKTDAKLTKDLVKLAGDLAKAKPPRGEAKSWKKHTSSYAKNAKALNKAVEKKNKKAAQKSLATLGKACAGCHAAHRPPAD
jgi:hypothetical protein